MSLKLTYDIYVGHLPKNIDERVLYEAFSRYGEVVDILCRYDKGPYGYSIVKFKFQEDAENILRETDKVCVNGHEMEIRSGKRSSVSEGNGAVCTKLAAPSSTTSHVRGMNYADPPIPPPDYRYMPQRLNNDKHEKQLPVMIEVICTSVENAVVFYGCPIFRYEELKNLNAKLNSICPNLIRLLRKPQENKIYSALYGEDMQWYRCLVLHATIPEKPGICVVQYIDYGNVDHVSYADMVDLPEPIKRIPTFAVKCILSNLMCNPKSHCDISYLHHLVNQRMSLCALSSWGVPQYNVLKCTSNAIDVVSELVRNGFAIYKSPKDLKAHVTNRTEKLTAKAQDGPKSRKMNGVAKCSKKSNEVKTTQSSKKNDEVKATHNHSDRCSPNEMDMKITHEHIQHEVPEMFVPKKIIKRGSDINGNLPALEAAKVKESVNHLLKIDYVISNLKLVNNVRELVSLTSDDYLINDAVEFLLSEADAKSSENLMDDVKEAYREYNNVLNEIKSCSDQTLLSDLKEKKEHQKKVLCTELQKFLESFDKSLLEKRKTIQNMIMNLESNVNAWMNVYLETQPATMEELLAAYNKEKENKCNIIKKARKNTNEKHKNFMAFMGDLQKEFSLNLMEDNVNYAYYLGNAVGKKGSWALKLDEALSEFGAALKEEMKTCNVSKGKNRISVIQCILEKMDIPKEKIDLKCEIYEKYTSLYAGLQNMTDIRHLYSEWSDIQEEIRRLSALCLSKDDKASYSGCCACANCNYLYSEWSDVQEEIQRLSALCLSKDDKASYNEKNYSNFTELHNLMLKEDYLMEALARHSALHFPEINMEHPDLHLSEYQNNSYLLKLSWKKEYFLEFQKCSRIEPSFISKFSSQDVVIKEFEFGSEPERNSFIKKAIIWREIKSRSLVKIEALFNKDEKCICAMLPNVSQTLYENPLPATADRKTACNILQQILLGLKDIHARGMTHGAVHPLAILYKDGELQLDFNYDLRFLHENLVIKGINFQVPCGEELCKSADMYGFGCLVLWILFPNLSFTSTAKGVPNLTAFQSILEDLLSAKDFVFLSALLSVNPDARPPSKTLLGEGFLKELRIVSDSL